MPTDPRVLITFRLGLPGKDWMDDLAHKYRLDRSVVLRSALVIARRHEAELIALLKEQD